MAQARLDISSIILNPAGLDNSKELLNYTGVCEIDFEFLQKKYDENSENFYKYLNFSIKRFQAKRERLNLKENEILDKKTLFVRKGELMMLIDNIATQQRFVGLLEGLANDEEQNNILRLEEEYHALKGLYLITLNGYDELVKKMAEEAEEAEEAIDEEDTDNGTKKEEYNLENLLPMGTPNFAKQSDRNNSETYSQSFVPRLEDQKELDLSNQASTPLRNGNTVRFSDVVASKVLSDYSTTIEDEETWRFVEPQTNMIEEISLVEDLQAIHLIVSKKISEDLADVELTALEKRDCARLKELKADLERKSEKLPIICNDSLKLEAVKAFRSATKWIKKVENLVCERGLHLQSEQKYSKPLELSSFKGHTEQSTNIYEFFSNYEVISRGFNTEDKALYLFSNYLDVSIKAEVRHIRTNYALMKEALIRKHGNVNILHMHKRNQIKKLKSVNIRSSRNDKIKYVKSYVEVLEQLKSLVEMNVKDYPEIKLEAFSYSNITDLAKLLPDFMFRSFSQKYVKEAARRNQEALSGQNTFEILMDMMKTTLKDLEFTNELYLEEDTEKEIKQPLVKTKVMNVDATINESNREKSRTFATEKYFGAPCIAHDTVKRKVKDCLSGRCKSFLEMKPIEREKMAVAKKVCKVCLLYICKVKQNNESCLLLNALPSGIICPTCKNNHVLKNILLCSEHNNASNTNIKSAISEFLPGFRKDTNIDLLFVGKIFKLGFPENPKPTRKNENAFDINTGKTVAKSDVYFKTRQDSASLSVYPTQVVNLNGTPVQILFDSGALGEMIKKDIAERLSLTILDEQSQSFTVAGGQTVHTNCPLYELTLGPNDRGEFFSFPLLGVERISSELPEVDLADVIDHVKRTLVSFNDSKSDFPKKIGGQEIHMIIGIKQSHIFPTREYVFEDGLQVWRSPLRDIYGSNIIFAGPIEVVKKAYNFLGQLPAFFQETCRIVEQFESKSLGFKGISVPEVESEDESVDDCVNKFFNSLYNDPHVTDITQTEADLLNVDPKVNVDCINCVICDNCKERIFKFKPVSRVLEKKHQQQEDAGCVVDYRCPECAICKKCKESDKMRATSIKEIAEDVLISNSVQVDPENKITTCQYPFTEEPISYLSKQWGDKKDNIDMAISILKTQRNKPPETRASVVRFNQEVYNKGFVAPLSELPEQIRNEILDSEFRHYFCWRSVAKPDSVSTPHRLVVDPTCSGFNNIIAKGSNCLTNLYKILISWRCYKYIFVSDITKMFNTLKLTPDMYKFSLYLFSESLDPQEDFQIWCQLTLMYGVKSASAQATYGLRKTADLKKLVYPLAHKIIMKWTYMDDSKGGANTKEMRDEMIRQLLEMVDYGGFKIKVVTKNQENPSDKCSDDGICTSYGGYRWLPMSDVMGYKCQEINFNVKRRGQKKPNPFQLCCEEDIDLLVKDIQFTKGNLLGRVLECFDIVGILEPLKVNYKIDLHKLPVTDLDDEVTGEFRRKWIQNLKLMFRSMSLLIPRSVIPEDAIDPEKIELIVAVDAASTMAGCCIYARTKSPNGSYYVRLLTSRSKSSYFNTPRNELISCLLGAETAFTVCNALEGRVSSVIFLTDSSISLCWISNTKAKLKQFVHSRVTQIHRLIGADSFFLISSHDNPADLLTRGTATFDDVKEGSEWQEGRAWMKLPFERMPIRSYQEVCASMTPEHIADVEKEVHTEFPATKVDEHTEPIAMNCFCVDDLADVESCDSSVEVSLSKDIPAIFAMNPNLQIQNKAKDDVNPNILLHTKAKDDVNSALEGVNEIYAVDFIKHGFKKGFLQLAFIFRFVSRLRHKVHINQHKIEFCSNCPICKVQTKLKASGFNKLTSKKSDQQSKFVVSPLDFFLAWTAICKIGTKEVKSITHHTKLKEYTEKDDILYGGGRLSLPAIRVETSTPIHEIDFNQPVFLVSDVVTYAIVMYVHWELCPHSGIDRTVSFVSKIIHVERIRKLVKFIRNTCPRCRYLMKKHYLPLTGNQSAYSLMKAIPFFSTMIDIAGVYKAHDSIKQRVTKPAYFLIQVCLISGCTSIGALEDMTVNSILLALTRSANRYGWPKYLVLDSQSSFKSLEHAKISFTDLAGNLWSKQNIILDYSTPLGHNERGRAESKIKILKEFLEKAAELGVKHSYLQWETIGLNIATMINSLPITSNQDDQAHTMGELGLITPNLFILGRNNARSPEKFVTVDFNPAKAIKEVVATNDKLIELLGDFIPRFIPGKRFTEARPPEVNDVVLFVVQESNRTRNIKYKYGKIVETNVDGRINKVVVEYRNYEEVVKRRVERSIKDLVLILASDEIDFNSKEHQLASYIQQKYL